MFRIGVVRGAGALAAGGLWILAVLWMVAGALPEAAGEGVLPPGASRVELEPRPGWVTSGVWSRDGAELLLVDSFRSEILRYAVAVPSAEASVVEAPSEAPSAGAHFLGGKEVPLRGSTEISRPSWIQRWGDGYLVEQEDGDFVELSPSLEPRHEVDVLEEAVGDAGRVSAIFGWTPLGSSLVTFSDLRHPGADPEQAFLSIPLRQPSAFEKLHVLAGGERALPLYLLGHPYLVSLGDRVYFIEMSSAPSIFEVAGGAGGARVRPLSAFPKGFEAYPALQISSDLRHVPALFETLERCRMAAGLYGWNGRLFVLARRPGAASDETVWSLTRIDPQRDEVVGTLELPTTAAHLTLIPGPRHWAILEKGPVRGFGQQDISTLLLIPNAWFFE